MSSVAVVIVSYRTPELLLRSLDALAGGSDLDVVVVDNASGDDTVAAVRRAHPSVTLLANATNVGFPAAANQGVRATRAPLVVVANADVLMTPSDIAALAQVVRGDPTVGVVGPRMVDAGSRTLPTVHRDMTLPRLAADQLLLADWWRYRVLRRGRPRGAAVQRVDWMTGAILLLRRAAFDAVGGFDEGVFMYGEEADLQHRIRAAGWSVCCVPSVVVRHDKGSSADPAFGSTRLARVHGSALYFRAVHGGPTQLRAAAALLSLGSLLRLVLRGAVAVVRGEDVRAACAPFVAALAVSASPRAVQTIRRRARHRHLHVMCFDHASGIGGAERSLAMLLQRLPRHGLRCSLAAPADGPLAATVAEGSPQVARVCWAPPRLRGGPSGLLRWLRAVGSTARLLRRAGVDVAHANTVRAALVVLPAARVARRPAVWHCRDLWLSQDRPRRAVPQRVLQSILQRLAARTIAVSEAVAAGLPLAQRTAVVRNGIDLTLANAIDGDSVAAARRRHNLPEDARLLVHAGRMVAWKGAEAAVRVAGPLLAADPTLRLVLAGGTPLGEDDGTAQRVRKLAAALGTQVRLVGHVDDLPALLAGAELLLATGAPEPFGLVLAEALAVGTPVAGWAHGSLPELIGPAGPDGAAAAGLLVAADDEPALRRAVAALLADPQRLSRLSAAARQRAASLDVDRTAAAVAAILRDVAVPHVGADAAAAAGSARGGQDPASTDA